MNETDQLRADLHCVETYIAEHGRTTGTVSWQMAQGSFERIKEALQQQFELGLKHVVTARPHKFLDAAALEEWAGTYAPDLFSAWELSDACELMDFWDWFDLNHPGGFTEFEKWFRDGGRRAGYE